MKHIRVLGFEQTQHYSKRNPPWIKAYRSDLNDPRFRRLDESARFQLQALRLIASENENWTPLNPATLKERMCVKELRIARLQQLGFIEVLDSSTPIRHERNAEDAWMILLDTWRSGPVTDGRGGLIQPGDRLSAATLAALHLIGGLQRLEALRDNPKDGSYARSEFIKAWREWVPQAPTPKQRKNRSKNER